MKKLILLLSMVAMVSLFTACSNDEGKTLETGDNQVTITSNESRSENDLVGISADIAINIEGVVTEIIGNKYVLDNGMVVIITEDTVFETENVGQVVDVDNLVEVGNFIQGYTGGEVDQDEVVADFINTNRKMEISSKIAINIEGVVTDINGNVYTLDNGKLIVVTEETVFETQNIGERVKVNDVIEIGNFIQGFTLGNPDDEEVVAAVISANEKIDVNASIIINIEGIITAIDGNIITLDQGQMFEVNEDTLYEMQVTGSEEDDMTKSVSDEFKIGNYVQGFTLDDMNQEVVLALVINYNGEL